MKRRSFAVYGKTGSKGQLMMYNREDMDRFLNQWPNESFVLEITVNPPQSSQSLICYYKKGILPEFQEAFKQMGEMISLSEVDIRLRLMSPVMHKSLEHGIEVYDLDEAGSHRLVEFIEDLKVKGAIDFGIEVPDPKNF